MDTQRPTKSLRRSEVAVFEAVSPHRAVSPTFRQKPTKSLRRSEVANFEAVSPDRAVSPTCRQKAAKSLVESEAEIFEAVRPPGAVRPTRVGSSLVPPDGEAEVGRVPVSGLGGVT